MPNKHQIQKDFYTKKNEWKESLKVNTKNKKEANQKLLFGESCFKEIVGTRVESLAFKDIPEHKTLVEETDKRIEEGKRREEKGLRNAQYDIYR